MVRGKNDWKLAALLPDTQIGYRVYEDGTVIEFHSEKAIDIAKLRDETGYITIDSGYKNTGATESKITFIDGDEGILHS
jgi:citrate synthase